ncbi:MAG: TonB-dependent receptor [Candidatus Gastranaerophilales bacterium]|nr:TonB-dependent receptor [Candidatus Gastranaerophilales bacterium]
MFRTIVLCCVVGVMLICQPLSAISKENFKLIKLEKGKVTNTNEQDKEIILENKQPSFLQFGEVKQDQVYSQSNIPEDIKTSGNSVDVISLKDIRETNTIAAKDILNTLPGISLYSRGSAGSLSPFYMRGWNKSLVTVDGIRINDPNYNQPYLDNILNDGIDRIEVVRGPQGALHGTQAQGGLISIFSRQGRGPLAIEAGSDMGSFGTFKENLAVQGERKNLDYYLGITRYDTNGGMKTNVDKRHDNDGYGNYSIASNVGTRVLDGKAEIRNILRYSASHKEVGQNGAYLNYDPRNDSYTNDLLETLKFTHSPTNWYNYDVKFGLYENRYKNIDPLDPGDWAESYTKYHNTRLSLDTQHNLLYKKLNTFTYGYNLEYNKFNNVSNGIEKEFVNNDVYFHDVINIKDIVFLRGGTRITNSSVWGTYASPNASLAVILPTFKIPDSYTKFRSSYGYSVNTPTPTQLYDTTWGGNPDLKPEKVEGWDVGFTQSFFNEKFLLDGTYFKSHHDNLIVSDGPWWASVYKNISSAQTSGYETAIKLNPFKNLNISLNYTYTDATQDHNDLGTGGGQLLYIPNNRWNYIVNYKPFSRISFYTKGIISSSRRGEYGGEGRISGFADTSIGTKLLLLKRKTTDLYLNAELNNLGNNKYQEVLGYHHPGLNFRAGVFLRKTFEKEEKL